MRKPIVAGNWKMHGSKQSAEVLLHAIKAGAENISSADNPVDLPVEIIVFPPFVFLPQAEQILKNSNIAWGGQNFYPAAQGAFTGEISASMLRDFACRYVLIGHSERRTLFGETDDMIAAKYQAAIAAGLSPVICVGESLEQRQQGL